MTGNRPIYPTKGGTSAILMLFKAIKSLDGKNGGAWLTGKWRYKSYNLFKMILPFWGSSSSSSYGLIW